MASAILPDCTALYLTDVIDHIRANRLESADISRERSSRFSRMLKPSIGSPFTGSYFGCEELRDGLLPAIGCIPISNHLSWMGGTWARWSRGLICLKPRRVLNCPRSPSTNTLSQNPRNPDIYFVCLVVSCTVDYVLFAPWLPLHLLCACSLRPRLSLL